MYNMPLHIYPVPVVGVGITSTEDANHYRISDISIIRANGHVRITYDD